MESSTAHKDLWQKEFLLGDISSSLSEKDLLLFIAFGDEHLFIVMFVSLLLFCTQ